MPTSKQGPSRGSQRVADRGSAIAPYLGGWAIPAFTLEISGGEASVHLHLTYLGGWAIPIFALEGSGA